MSPIPANDLDRRRAAARRTAWIVAGIALAVFVLFFSALLTKVPMAAHKIF